MSLSCCEAPEPLWTQRVIEKQYADIFYCGKCGTVSASERYPTPLRLFPLSDARCVNCGGERPEGGPCSACGLTFEEDQELHQKYADLHPSKRFVRAAKALEQGGRLTLALKLASAEIAWAEAWQDAWMTRIRIMGELGQVDRALDEGYEFASADGVPFEIYQLLVKLEVKAANYDGAVRTLQMGLKLRPDDPHLATAFAEILLERDDRSNAVKMARIGLHDPETEKRAVKVMGEVGEIYYTTDMYPEALGACSVCGPLQEKYEPLAWLRAR